MGFQCGNGSRITCVRAYRDDEEQDLNLSQRGEEGYYMAAQVKEIEVIVQSFKRGEPRKEVFLRDAGGALRILIGYCGERVA
jgi:hypothetical protein